MKYLGVYLAIAMGLGLVILTDNRLALLLVLVGGAIFYFFALRSALVAWPKVNLAATVAAVTGAYYFLGAVPVNLGLMLDENYIGGYLYKFYRDYDPAHEAVAALLVLLCTAALFSWPSQLQPRLLGRMWSPQAWYGSDGAGQTRSADAALRAFVLAITGLGLYLALTKQLAIDFNPVNSAQFGAQQSRLIMTIYFIVFIASPAVLPCLVYLATLSVKRGRAPVVWAACGVAILVVLFLMGRRPLFAGLLLAVVAAVFFSGLRLSWSRWGVALAAGVAILLSASVPFLQARAAGAGSVGAVEMFSIDALERHAVAARSENLIFTTVMRADLLGELSRIVDRYPLSQAFGGAGMGSQMAVLVPGAIWPGKAVFLRTETLSDERILERAGLPPSDVAGTPVLYSYADFGWLAPLGMAAQVMLYFGAVAVLIRLSRSYAVWMVGVFMSLANALQLDAFNFGGMLFYFAYTAGIGAGLFAVGFFAQGRPGQVAPVAGEPSSPPRKLRYEGMTVNPPQRFR